MGSPKMDGRGFGIFPSFRFGKFESRLPWGSGPCLAGLKEIAEESQETSSGEEPVEEAANKKADVDEEEEAGEDVFEYSPEEALEDDTEGESLFDCCVSDLRKREKIKLWRAAVKKREENVKKEESIKGGRDEEDDIREDSEEEERELLGPSAEYVPQEEIVLESSLEDMSLPRALGTIGLPTVRGLESSQEGALLIANQVAGAIHHIEERREANLRLRGRKKAAGRSFKTPEMVEKEKEDAKWATAKVKEELRLVHEAYQFFRFRNKTRYGDFLPSPTQFH